jgi:pseudouridine kinase
MGRTSPRIACIGGIDVDYKARVKAPAQHGTSNPVTVKSCTGGVAGNIARNLARLRCDVSLFSIVGADSPGEAIARELKDLGIDDSHLTRSPSQPTASYTAVLESEGQLFIGLANMEIFEEMSPAWADGIAPELASFSIWIVDANLPGATIARLLKNHKNNAIVLADPISIAKAEKFKGLLAYADVIFPNKKEAAVLSGRRAETQAEIEAAANEIRRRGTGSVVVTLGEEGIYVDDGKRREFVQAIPPACVRDVTGAGDALVAGYAYGIANGEKNPARLALAAASLALETEDSVSREMTPERLAQRIEDYLSRKKGP